jgi:TolB-like protein
VHELQEVLLPLSEDFLRSDRTNLALKSELLWVDIHALAGGGEETLGLVRGGLLQDLVGLDPEFDRWLESERHRVTGLARAVGERVLAGASDPEAAIVSANRLIHLDPGNEAAWRALIAAHSDQGDWAGAALSFDRCAAALCVATGDGPSPETRALLDRVRGQGVVPSSISTRAMAPARSLRPGMRLGVMPLRLLDATGEDSLSLGLAEEITTALSRFRWITCIGSTSLARLIGEAPGREAGWQGLELDFLLDGTVQRGGTRVRVNMRLLDLRADGEVVWARRFDRDATDLLSLQDEIAAETVAQVDPELLLREGGRAETRPSTDPTAYELTLRAIPAVYRLDRSEYSSAGTLLAAAVAADPGCAAAHAWWAYWHLLLVGQGWAGEPEVAMARAEALAERAVTLDPADSRALTLAGHVRAFLHRRVRDAIALHDQALSINPNLALAWVFSSLAHAYGGELDQALERASQAKRLAPLDPHGFMADAALMMPHLLRREYAIAADLGRRATGLAPGFTANWKLYLSALGHLGRVEEAAAACRQLLRLEPGLTVSEAVRRSPLVQERDLDLYATGLKLAGLPL